MEERRTSKKYPPRVPERAIRMVLEHAKDYDSEWEAIGSIAAKISCTDEILRGWVRLADRDRGLRPGLTSDERDLMKALERENRELRHANEILRKVSAYFARAEQGSQYRPRSRSSTHTAKFRVSSRCARSCRSDRRTTTSMRLAVSIRSGCHCGPSAISGYGPKSVGYRPRVSKSMVYARSGDSSIGSGIRIVRCTTARLMAETGLAGVIRGKPVKTMASNSAASSPRDDVNRQFQAACPNTLWADKPKVPCAYRME